jgi:uncharacterized LabA/DUF88 family protein
LEAIAMERAAVFIDIGYFSKVLKHCFGEPRINFESFSDLLCGEKERFRTYVYDCAPYESNPPTEEEQRRTANHVRFVKSLSRLNRFEVRLGKTAFNPHTGEFYQKRVEVLLTVDLMRMAWSRQITTAILVTGNSDFVPAIESAKSAGVLVMLFYKDCEELDGGAITRSMDELLSSCDDTEIIEDSIIDESTF